MSRKDDGSGTYGKQSVPTLPMMPRVQEPAAVGEPVEHDEPTQQRCPLCIGRGYVPPDLAIAFDHYCTKLRGEQR